METGPGEPRQWNKSIPHYIYIYSLYFSHRNLKSSPFFLLFSMPVRRPKRPDRMHMQAIFFFSIQTTWATSRQQLTIWKCMICKQLWRQHIPDCSIWLAIFLLLNDTVLNSSSLLKLGIIVCTWTVSGAGVVWRKKTRSFE